MRLTHTPAPTSATKSVYKVEIKTYYGDADGYSSCNFTVEKDQIRQVIAEILIVDNQFPHGRGGCRMMYDQSNYFSMSYEAYQANGDQHDGYWEWFDREMGDFPYDSDGEQNHSIDSIKVWWYNENGLRHAVTFDQYDDLLTDLKALNTKHRLGDYDIWESPRYPYGGENDKAGMAKYNADHARLSAQFTAYRADAIEMVKKHSQ